MRKSSRKRMLAVCLACCLCVLAFAQQVTFKVKNVTVKTAVIKFKKATGYSFVFGSSKVDTNKRISVNANNQPLRDVISQILVGQNLDYEINGKFVVVRERQQISPQRFNSNDSQIKVTDKVTGRVTDENGEPVIGATIRVVGQKGGSVTDTDGSYIISCPANATLEFNYIGFKNQLIRLNGRKMIDVRLAEESTNLNEVVVTALGIKKDARKVGYAISNIEANELVKTASPSLGTALYGKAAGVEVRTAPGGVAGSISINVRGISSITGSNQPLIVLDGVPIRNGEANNSDYWTDPRVESNGLSDINPEDIENISILKGAAATAQYGSEGANGVVMITTKSGKGRKGVGVDFNASWTGNFVAYMPEYQTTYGPGPAPQSRTSTDANGWYTYTNRNGESVRGVLNGTSYFGPKYDGSSVYYYDGTMRSYNAITSNPWSNVFRTGYDQQYNIALTNSTDKGNLRFSYTYLNSLPNQYNSNFTKHTFNLTGTYNILPNLKFDYSVNYMTEHVKNRPYRMYRLLSNFGGMFGAFDDITWLRNHTVTSAGYRNRVYTATDIDNPKEGFAYTLGCGALIDEYFWDIFGKAQYETNDRLIAKVAPSWDIVPGLTLKASLATDFTSEKIENKNDTETPIANIDTSNSGYSLTGSYELQNNRYTILYGDIMLMYDKDLTDKLNLNAFVGWSGRRETSYDLGSSTNGGLSTENWFNLAASFKQANTFEKEMHLLKTAWFGDLSLGWDNWAYLEGTLRNEKSSTLYYTNNSFWYPSVNASIIISELLKDKKPRWMDYAKLRASYGIVGLAPDIYSASMAFNQSSASGYVYEIQGSSLGSNALKPEKTYEWEFGLEGKFLKNRIGFDAAWYHKDIKDQILNTTTAASTGASSIMMNIGEFVSKGLELSLYGTPLQTKYWRIDVRGNIAFNKNKVIRLANGVNILQHEKWDNGAAYLYSSVGGELGDFYAYAPKTNDKGQKIVGSDGYYELTDKPVKVGNTMPKYIGGFGLTVTYRNVYLDCSLSFRHGGAVFNMPYEYMMGRGTLVESMANRDAKHGGLTYYLDDNRNIISASTAPAGRVLYDDGMILPGVKEDGTKNDIMISADRMYNWTYNWGTDAPTYYSHSIFNNSYVKVREIVLGYNFPKSIIEKFHCTKLQVSAYARNPFYIYKNLPIFDAEATDATSWIGQSWIGGSSVTTRSFGLSLRASF